jgi:hypothetical protein
LRFAYRLTHSRERARDLLGRTNLRLVRTGWDPNAVLLKKALCRLVWSEFTHELSESAAARHAEEVFLREEGIHAEQPPAAPAGLDPLRAPQNPVRHALSPEQHAVRAETEREEDARAEKERTRLRAHLAALRKTFETNEDEVNLLWLDHRLKAVEAASAADAELPPEPSPAALAHETGRDVSDFYAAKKRRDRAVRKILGVDDEEPR